MTPDDRFAFTTNLRRRRRPRATRSRPTAHSPLDNATAGIAVDGDRLREEDLSDDRRFLYVLDADGGRIYGWSVGALVPKFRRVLETDEGGAILFEWQGLAVRSDPGMRRLLGSLVSPTETPAPTVGWTTASAQSRASFAPVPTHPYPRWCSRPRR